jgi:hypothetical protein
MKFVVLGLIILIVGIGLIRYSSILSALAAIIGLSVMMKGKRKF